MIPGDGTGGCCPQYHRAVELIGRRWTGAIVAVLLAEDDPLRFSELRSAVPGLSDRVLSQRLRELEVEQLVLREVHPGPPVRVAYALTDKGRDLDTVVRALERWGNRWMDCGGAAPVGASSGAPADDHPLG
ncbi:helix-turn-helix domain-containing protein [Patulibacter sp.]|uniref:winged helix-turn-helix transcriptional regulator n=1 Tax=Patulibacter sp. TaxID=1912859 RepID=UPI0027253FE8|nr:helix-turn-helix domain-containing protein [Patulibacter sp.]MDO9406808.1 helix-turn-helix domain-containing protein [Patulibacter sp.]